MVYLFPIKKEDVSRPMFLVFKIVLYLKYSKMKNFLNLKEFDFKIEN